jgi:hypothetical protein
VDGLAAGVEEDDAVERAEMSSLLDSLVDEVREARAEWIAKS